MTKRPTRARGYRCALAITLATAVAPLASCSDDDDDARPTAAEAPQGDARAAQPLQLTPAQQQGTRRARELRIQRTAGDPVDRGFAPTGGAR